MSINVLSPQIYNRISAGEVVEKPASVVKELVENSIDAGATRIKIEVTGGGIQQIVVSDNGCGIDKDDLPLAFLPHATSKISNLDDLDDIETLGFRGEALASICAVSMVKLSTKTASSDTGYMIESSGGDISKISEVARVQGTTISVSNLFYNTPVRAKFLRKPKTEEGEITHLVEKFMLSRPEICFEYYVDNKQIYTTNAQGLNDVIYAIYGKEVYDNLLEVKLDDDAAKVTGFVCSPKLSRPNRNMQTLFVNGRYVENYMVSACIQGAYEHFLMKGRFPIYILNLEIPFEKVDVNIHPNKREVKFQESSKVFVAIRRAVEKTLVDANLIADFEFTSREQHEWENLSIKNDESPERTSFFAEQKTNIEPLSDTAGASYKVKVDSFENKDIIPHKSDKIETINMPDFSNIKIGSRGKNQPGGYIEFDQVEETLVPESAGFPKIEKNKEVKSESFLEAKVVDEIKIVGVIFKTYILTEYNDSMYVVDQHAMHERQLYDKLRKQIDEKKLVKQDLLFPYEFSLKDLDAEKFESKIENLKALGFEIEQNGNDFKIKTVPFLLFNIQLNKFIEDILGDETIKDRTASELINNKLCQTACKHAIRAGDEVTKEEIAYLIEEMKGGVLLCPHGRPIVVKITKADFEKMFKRTL